MSKDQIEQLLRIMWFVLIIVLLHTGCTEKEDVEPPAKEELLIGSWEQYERCELYPGGVSCSPSGNTRYTFTADNKFILVYGYSHPVTILGEWIWISDTRLFMYNGESTDGNGYGDQEVTVVSLTEKEMAWNYDWAYDPTDVWKYTKL